MSLYAIFSDIHNETNNLEKTLAYLATRSVDFYLNLGDMGARPLPMLDALPIRHAFGNWEVSQLHKFPAQRQDEIASWPARLTGPGWVAAHASPIMPPACITLADTRAYMARHRPRWMQLFPSLLHDEKAVWAALAHLAANNQRIAFHGHTHVQAVQQLDAENHLRRLAGSHIVLAPDTLTLVGVGSVGVPRDGNHLRCVLFDDARFEVELLSIKSLK